MRCYTRTSLDPPGFKAFLPPPIDALIADPGEQHKKVRSDHAP
jgi:hypothetical protein